MLGWISEGEQKFTKRNKPPQGGQGVRKKKNKMHPVAIAFNASYESMRLFCQAMYDENQEEMFSITTGRDVFHNYIVTSLNDTPYTTGEIDLANWNSMADHDKGCEAFRQRHEEEGWKMDLEMGGWENKDWVTTCLEQNPPRCPECGCSGTRSLDKSTCFGCEC